MEHKDREERTLSRTADINRAAVLLDLEGAKNSDLHVCAATGCNRPATPLLTTPSDRGGIDRVGGHERRRIS